MNLARLSAFGLLAACLLPTCLLAASPSPSPSPPATKTHRHTTHSSKAKRAAVHSAKPPATKPKPKPKAKPKPPIPKPKAKPPVPKPPTPIPPVTIIAPQPPVPQILYSPETRPLYRYRRDDTAMATHIYVNAFHRGVTPLSPYIFGNFIEHLGGVVYHTLWANVLTNPNLEKIGADDVAPRGWRLDGSASWDANGYQSPLAVRLGDAPDGGQPLGSALSQRVFLPVARMRHYTLTFWARRGGSAIGGGPGGVSTLRVALCDGTERPGSNAYVSTDLMISGDQWAPQTVRWTLPDKNPALGEPVWFEVTANGQPIIVDQVSLVPDDAVDGMDPDTLAAARAWDIPLLRLAGNFSSGYHWRDGIGPVLQRPTQQNVAWPGSIETNAFGTDELADFARRIGNVPLQIGVNAGNGTPEEAADWVRYCESQHIPVAVWEIGNELYGDWQIGHTDPAGNAARYVQFRNAMLQVDPKLHLIATGKGNSYLPVNLERGRTWNDAILRAAVANNGAAPDYLSIHPLVPLPGNLSDRPYAEQFESALAHPAFMDDTLIPELKKEIVAVEGASAKTRIAPTEWGPIVGSKTWQSSVNHNALSGALYNALALNTFLRNGDWVTLANVTALLHGCGIQKTNGVVYVEPGYYTLQLYSRAAPSIPLETDWSGPGRDVPQRGFLPAAANVPDIDVFSAFSADGQRLTIFAVNRCLDSARTMTLEVAGFSAQTDEATILTAADTKTQNRWDQPNAVAPTPFALPPTLLQGAPVTLPPHALVVITLEKASSK